MRTYDPRLPKTDGKDPFTVDLLRSLSRELRGLVRDIDLMSYGYISGTRGKGTAAPTTGTWNKGDYIKNSNPSELGTTGSKYWIRGWWCSVGGEPGTWLEDRGLTGN